jgi:hypothetical protein
MGLRFVRPETVRLHLSEGHWIEIKERLPFGEAERLRGMNFQLRASSDSFGKGAGQDDLRIDMSAYKLARMEAYIVDWSARDEQDKPVRVSRDALAALDQESADEIEQALDSHIEELAKKTEADPTRAIEGELVSTL